MRAPERRSAGLLVALLALLLQLPALRGELIWDDALLLGSWSDLYLTPARFVEAVTHPLGMETFYWRPLATTTFLLETLVHGGAVWGFRLTAALLHAGVAFLAYRLARRLLGEGWPPLLAALLFAVHPLTVEAATWPSGRFDQLSTLLVLATLALVPEGPERVGVGRRIAIGCTAALAAMSKENALLLPAFVLVWDLALHPPEKGWLAALLSRATSTLSATAGIVVVLLLRFELLGYVLRPRPSSVARAGDLLQHVALVGRTLFMDALLFVFPFGTVGPAYHVPRPVPVDSAPAWVGIGLFALIGVAVVVGFARRRPAAFVGAALLLALLPVSQVVPLDMAGGLYTADRFLYLPSLFAVLSVAGVISAWARSPSARREVGFAAAALVAAFAVDRVAFVQPCWNSAADFWERAAEMAPGSDVVLANLYEIRIKQGRVEDAESIARKLIEEYPTGDYGRLLSDAQLRQGTAQDALTTLDRSIAARPADVDLLLQRGWLLLQMKREVAAGEDYRRALAQLDRDPAPKMRPKRPEVLAGAAASTLLAGGDRARAAGWTDEARELILANDTRGRLLLLWSEIALGRDAAAQETLARVASPAQIDLLQLVTHCARFAPDSGIDAAVLRRARAADVSADELLLARIEGFERAGRFDRAAGALRDLIRDDPESYEGHRRLWSLTVDGETHGGDAVALARRLTELRPNSSDAWDCLGYSLWSAEPRDSAGAEEALSKAVDLDPEYPDARFHHGMLLVRTGRKDDGLKEIRRAREQAEGLGLRELVQSIDRTLRDLR